MVVLIVFHDDLDNDIHDHWIVPLVEDNTHQNKDQVDEKTVDRLAFHDENNPAVVVNVLVVVVVVNMVNET
jgi:hypothetical protein